MAHLTAEHERISELRDDSSSWRRWGPYVSDRAWGTVREDYSSNGDAWAYLPHDLARSKAYRWGEDGIAGICDRYQLLCFAPAFWNGRDPILKERLFGLVPSEANHGEDVKECYFAIDNIPSHAYMKYLYKYPQAPYPYQDLIDNNRRRGPTDAEYELLDTGVFKDNRYFDIFIEYAKASPEDICVRIEAFNRGPEAAPLHMIPQLWFRNVWGWGTNQVPVPVISAVTDNPGVCCVEAETPELCALGHLPVVYQLGKHLLCGSSGATLLFTDNETNAARVFGHGSESRSCFTKDAIGRAIVNGEAACNPARSGSKVAFHYSFPSVPPGGSVIARLRLAPKSTGAPGLAEVDTIVDQRRSEADAFFASLHPRGATGDEQTLQRRAIAALLWNKQFYLYDVHRWLDGDDPSCPPPAARTQIRNQHWRHLNTMRVLLVPDKWEYPWFATWDLAFHAVTMALVDPRFAMHQLWYLLFEQFQHPNGQLPAYEWEFSDVNPPVHAWAVWRVYNMARLQHGITDRTFLERCFHKLLINFAWWVNKLDREGNNIFEGGFLGLDNITVVDRSVACREGSVLEQSDGTGWMGMFCLNMMRIALELAKENPAYESLATKFFQHYVYVAAAMKHRGQRDYALWDEEDGFFYDVLRRPDGSFQKFRVRSLVGIVPLFAVERLERSWIEPFKEFRRNLDWFLQNRPELTKQVVHTVEHDHGTTHVLTIVDQSQLRRILKRVWDPREFLSDYGMRSLSKTHRDHPFEFEGMRVDYEPGESVSKLKGGNSNWRGPIWFPTCFLLIESLRKLAKAFGADFQVPVEGQPKPQLTFGELAQSMAERLLLLYARDPATGERPAFGEREEFATDPHWRDHLLFFEYFHGETGAGLGACQQAGWTALLANLIDEWRVKE